MRLKVLLIVLATAPASLWADQVTMKNGDRLTGAIQKSDGKTLTLKSDYAGVLTLPWDAIATVKSDKPLNVALKGGKTIQGTVETAGTNVEVATTGTKQEVPVAEVTAIRDADEQKAFERLEHPGWLELWNGAVSFGLAGTAGNSETSSLTAGVNAVRETRNDKLTTYIAAVKASATVNGTNSNTAQAIRFGWAYNHNLTPRVFATAFNDWENDRFQDLNLRMVGGVGLGFTLIKSDRNTLALQGGGDFSHAHFHAVPNVNAGEAFWGDDYSLKLTKLTSIVQSFRMFNDLSQTGEYRMNLDAGAATQLKKWLVWNVTVSDRYLSTPVPGLKKNDFLYSTGIGIKFAR
ncbi:MAG TPA: DUF481 domain-containing protein [Bryobacteraceae bacterium]|nr:DUF481 domain-containing protein [Bryobacteraceae bacterium]